jgi:hypothetical protein
VRGVAGPDGGQGLVQAGVRTTGAGEALIEVDLIVRTPSVARAGAEP